MLNQHQTIKDNIKRFNKPNPLADYLLPLIGHKKEVKIADIGSGPYSTIGHYLDGVKVDIYHSDNQDFTKFWKKYNATPLVHIEHQDMEKLTYPDDFFDIVHCVNALDHTRNAPSAIMEMIRVCKPGGYVYIDCHLDQLSTGHKHKWNMKENGCLNDGHNSFCLKPLGFDIKFIDNGGESRYNRIVATLQKHD